MTKAIRRKRLEILYKIEDMKEKCNCATGAISKNCPNCQEIKRLGTELLKYNNKRKSIALEKNNDDAVFDSINFVPRKAKGDKMILDWSNHHDIILKYSKTHRTTELAKILNVSPTDLQNYYSRNGIVDFLDGRKNAVIYNYKIKNRIIHTGTMSELHQLTGVSVSTLRHWRKQPGKNDERLVVVHE